MAFNGIRTSSDRIAPKRSEPLRSAVKAPAGSPPVQDDGSFEPVYRPDPSRRPAEAVAARALNPKTERLIDLIGSHLGSSHEEILALRALALTHERDVVECFMALFHQRVQPHSGPASPLDPASLAAPGQLALHYCGLHGSAVFCVDRASLPEMELHHGRRLERVDPSWAPFAPPESLDS